MIMFMTISRISRVGCCLIGLILWLTIACAASAPTPTALSPDNAIRLYTRTPTPTITPTPTVHPQVPYQRGLVQRDAWGLETALEQFDAALDIAPSAPVYASRAEVYRLLGRYEEASADIKASLTLDPELPEAWRQKALLSHTQAQWDEALAAVDKLIGLEPEDGSAYVLRAQINAEGFGKILQAQVDYGRAIRLDRVYDRATLIERWHILAKLEDWEEAVIVGHKMTTTGSEDPLRYYYRAWPLIELGRIDEAIQKLIFGIERHPDYPVALYYALGVAYYERHAWSEGIQALEVAWIQSGASTHENVVEHALDITKADILGHLGVAYLELKQCETGAAMVERAVADSARLSDWYWALDRIEACYIAITPTPTSTPAP